MPAGAQTARQQLSGVQKAALLLIALGEDASAELLKHLSEEEVSRLASEMVALKEVPSDEINVVIREFEQMREAQEYVVRGGKDYAEKLLARVYGPEVAKRLIQQLGVDITYIEVLRRADPQQLANFLQSEHPQTAALVLSLLEPEQAASVLAALPAELRSDVAFRMATLEQISPDVLSRVADVIGTKLQAVGSRGRRSYGGLRVVAEMLNKLDSATSKQILEQIEEKEPELAENIRRLIFVFEDFLKVDVAAIQEIVSRVDRKVLTVALKGASEELRNHFLKPMSQRGRQMLLEDMEALGPVKLREVEAAQQQIIALARQLEAEGIISLQGEEGEQYVE